MRVLYTNVHILVDVQKLHRNTLMYLSYTLKYPKNILNILQYHAYIIERLFFYFNKTSKYIVIPSKTLKYLWPYFYYTLIYFYILKSYKLKLSWNLCITHFYVLSPYYYHEASLFYKNVLAHDVFAKIQ